MIHNLKPYPAYKPSGVPSLGAVPAHWEVLALKRLGWFKSGTGFPIEEQGQQDLEIPFFKVSDMNLPSNDLVMEIWNNAVSHSTAARLGATVFPPGTIIFPKVGGALLTNKRRVVEHHFCMDNNIMGFVVKHGNPDFLLLLLQNLDLATIAKPGPVPAISEGEIREIRTVLPSLPEQTAIVRFLDHADRRIQRYLRAKQKLIALLEEQKQAIIHQAVTGQIDVRTGQPYPAYKPSGVEWLEDVPAHWDMMRARFLFKEIDIRSTTGEETHLSMSQTLGLVPSHMVERTLTSDSYIGGKLCEEGDLVLNRLKAHLGVFALAKQAGVISPDYSVFRKRGAEDMEYYERVCKLPALRTELRIRAKGIVEGFWRLYTEDLFDIRLPVPSFLEQRAIAEYVAKITLSIDDAISRSQRQIELLREYRTRLIADVVTGKLDVREAAATLPEVDPLAVDDTLGDALNPDVESALDELAAVSEEAEA